MQKRLLFIGTLLAFALGNLRAYPTQEINDRNRKAVVEIFVQKDNGERGQATGFFISDHQLVTNFHVWRGVQEARIQLWDHSSPSLHLQKVYPYPREDLVILELDPNSSQYWCKITPGDTGVKIGDDIMVMGYPNGTWNVNSGTILHLGDSKNYLDSGEFPVVFLTSTWGAPGQSGSPLFDKDGNVIGIIEGGNSDHYGVQAISTQLLNGFFRMTMVLDSFDMRTSDQIAYDTAHGIN
jgi:S1-C subfamily serine protease